MATSSREDAAMTNNIQHLWRKPGGWMIGDTYDDKSLLHTDGWLLCHLHHVVKGEMPREDEQRELLAILDLHENR